MRVNGGRIRHIREANVLTMHEVARLSGVSYNSLYRIENGKSGARQSTVRKIARTLGVDAATLVIPQEEKAM